MSRRPDADLLTDMRGAIERVHAYVAGMSRDAFLDDSKTQDAVIRNLEVIGEASKGVSKVLRDRYAEVAWKDIGAVRDRLIHHYSGVNLDIVWDIAATELAKLDAQIARIQKVEYNE
jgi:uncharacterized protein with HEPN domain